MISKDQTEDGLVEIKWDDFVKALDFKFIVEVGMDLQVLTKEENIWINEYVMDITNLIKNRFNFRQ